MVADGEENEVDGGADEPDEQGSVIGADGAALAAELDRLHTRRDQLADDLETEFQAHPLGPVLATLPRVGPRTGAKILAAVGDGIRFATGAQLAAYAGPAPVTRQSGSSVGGKTQSRRGNHRLKRRHVIHLIHSGSGGCS